MFRHYCAAWLVRLLSMPWFCIFNVYMMMCGLSDCLCSLVLCCTVLFVCSSYVAFHFIFILHVCQLVLLLCPFLAGSCQCSFTRVRVFLQFEVPMGHISQRLSTSDAVFPAVVAGGPACFLKGLGSFRWEIHYVVFQKNAQNLANKFFLPTNHCVTWKLSRFALML